MTKATLRKQHAILQAATILFNQRGVAGTGIEAIADLAQVSRQSVYTYFTSKEGILHALLEKFFRAGTDEWLNEHAQAQRIATRRQLEAELFDFMRVAVRTLMDSEYLKVMRIVVAESAGNPVLGDQFRQALALPLMGVVRSILSRVDRPVQVDLDVAMRFAVGPLLPYVLLDGLLRGEDLVMPREDHLRVLAGLVASAYWHYDT